MAHGASGSAGGVDDILSEDLLRDAVDLLVRVVESGGALIIFVGAVLAFGRFVVAAVQRRRDHDFVGVRLGLGRYLALGLEFQLAGDILSTAIAPTYEEIGKLAAVAAIRTALNFFLRKEIEEEHRQLDDDDHPSSSTSGAASP